MTHKALVTRRGAARTEASFAAESARAEEIGLSVEHELSEGTLVSGDEKNFAELEKQGYRVKLLPDTNILEVGSYRIDIERGAPRIPPKLRVPKKLEKTWPHHLVQLAAPPSEEWVRAIEAQGVDVVEPISAYGLFVVGSPEEVNKLKSLSFVVWVGPFQPAYRIAPNLKGLRGKLKHLAIGVYPREEVDAVRKALRRAQATIIRETPPTEGDHPGYTKFLVEADAKDVAAFACLPGVRWLEYRPPMEPFGERETQIVAENLDGAAPPNTAPLTGFQAWLAAVGLNGGGVTVSICDTGVDANANNNVSAHADLLGRQAAFVDYTAGAVTTDTDGHGTHVAGIAVGNAASAQVEAAAPNDFLWGQGVAPQANYVAQNFLLSSPQPSTQTLIRDAATNGAQVMNNSWGFNGSGGSGYTAGCRTIDIGVRDPNTAVAGIEYLVLVCAAGNDGGRPRSISNPHETKNDIVVGNALTSRPGVRFPSDDIRGIAGTSGRGPAVDNRILPVVVAPGTDVSSAFSRTSARVPIPGTGIPDPANPGSQINQYTFMTGTSQATPHVSGACALLIEWWRQRTPGKNPSPAMLKALLINGAEDLAGGENWRAFGLGASLGGGLFSLSPVGFTPNRIVDQGSGGFAILNQVASAAQVVNAGDWFFNSATDTLRHRPLTAGAFRLHLRDSTPVGSIPSNDQGWGHVSLENILLQAPTSDRGPRIFSDQRHALTANGQEHLIRVAPVDTTRPMRITLVWTDPPGAANANPALVNDLDLEVTEVATGTVFKGNVFVNGFSTAGGNFDNRNNTECVYIQNPAGTYEVRVIASALSANARPPFDNVGWQDFALVIDNAEVPAAAPVSVVPVIDRSSSMVFYGYENITRISSKQFVDLMSIDDRLGVVSFGSTATVEYPPGAGPVLQTIIGAPTRAAAEAEIDGIVFGGSTFMGGGINRARDLLVPAAGARAIVLLSDGYDNKGQVAANPSALDAVTSLPANLPVYTCAMGPASDQGLLEQIASITTGRYYYMPTIDDLFEIYNYIRGQVTGDGIIANESATASSSRVGAFVDVQATEATFTVAWADPKLRFVTGDARKANEVSIRLRDPGGRLVHPAASWVRRTVGAGYVVFEVQEPTPGRWFVEVATVGDTHLRYTVGGFVRSPLRLLVSVLPRRVLAGKPLDILAQVLDGRTAIKGVNAVGQVVAPALSIQGLEAKHREQLRRIKPARAVGGDKLPVNIAKLVALQRDMLKKKKPDIFSHVAASMAFRDATPAGATEPALQARFTATQQQGSYNAVVTASGTSPGSNSRFVRKQLVSVLVR